eukprot:44430_1
MRMKMIVMMMMMIVMIVIQIQKEKQQKEELEEEEDEDERREPIPRLIDESQQKTMDEFRGLNQEEEFEEERLEFYQNDTNIVKNQTYVGWKMKADKYKKEVEISENKRKQSVATMERYKKQVQQLQNAQSNDTEYETQIDGLKFEISKFKKKHQESEKIRKDSISTLHDNLFAKLLEAEAEHEEMVADYNKRIAKLQKSNKMIQDAVNEMSATKINTIAQLANTVQELRETVTNLSKTIDILTNQNKQLRDKTAVQHISNSLSSWLG